MLSTENTLHRSTAIALSIAGSDSSGGAGIQADLKAFSALGVYGASVITAVTAQNTQAVTAVHEIPTDIILAQIVAVLDDLNVGAIKIGMLSSSEIIETVCEGLQASLIPVVLDPVMVAKSGDLLLKQNAVECLRSLIMPKAALITPNLPEAATLLRCDPAADESGMQSQGEALLELGAKAVLMKGGHAKGSECVDFLITRDAAPVRFQASRIQTSNTHGTGCTLSASIAAGIAGGASLVDAVTAAHDYLNQAIQSAHRLRVGQGHGPVHHFHRFW